MTKHCVIARYMFAAVMLTMAAGLLSLRANAQNDACRVQAVDFRGWKAQQVSNASVRLTFVPQLGGRLMQVEFDGHPYLFVNPRFTGKYVSSEEAAGRWINYGGDKIWPMPEGNQDEEHWVLESGTLDDAPYTFRVLEEGGRCTVELSGPADAITGLAYTRQITLDSKSTAIHFHATMRNTTAHTLHWAVQSVSQYDLQSHNHPGQFNRDFWAYTALRPESSYPDGYHVRSGLSDDPSFEARDGLFRLHWMYLQNEVWVDSNAGWLAVDDGESGFGMIERFSFEPTADYPGKATVIFYKNGPSVSFDKEGNPKLSADGEERTPYYMEAEINSPVVRLLAGSSAAFDTTWYPLRLGHDLQRVTEAGATTHHLRALSTQSGIEIQGAFGVVTDGHLELRIYNDGGRDAKRITLQNVSPQQPVSLHQTVPVPFPGSRVALHLIDGNGNDWGMLDEAVVSQAEGSN